MKSNQNRDFFYVRQHHLVRLVKNSNFQVEDETGTEQTVHFLAARKLAIAILETKSYLYSQWFPEYDNDVPDSLLCDIDLSDKQC